MPPHKVGRGRWGIKWQYKLKKCLVIRVNILKRVIINIIHMIIEWWNAIEVVAKSSLIAQITI